MASKASRIRELVEVAHEIARAPGSLVAPLVKDTGLSVEGVWHGFANHVEAQPTDTQLQRLLDSVCPAERVTVVLSSNVFVAALRAIALAVASGKEVVVRPSRRDPTFATALVQRWSCPAVSLEPDLDMARVSAGDVHVYGRDETIEDIRRRVTTKGTVWGHGSGFGLAWIGREAPLEFSADALAQDVVAFDQRGCLSPRIVFVEGAEARGERFLHAVHAALARWETRVPRGDLSASEVQDARRYADTLRMLGTYEQGSSFGVGLALPHVPLLLPPPGRHLHLVAVPTAAEAAKALTPLAKYVVSAGLSDPSSATNPAPPHARISGLGTMQRPPLDGPVDLRPA